MRIDWSDRTTQASLLAGGAALLGFALMKSRQRQQGGSATTYSGRAPALAGEAAHGWVNHSGGARASAGPEGMRDPPRDWTAVDEASDESFPASDPPALFSKVD